MIVGFTGSRDYPRGDLVYNFVIVLAAKYPGSTVISGGRGNVDIHAEEAGVEAGLEVISYRPTEEGVDVAHYKPDTGEWSVNPMLGYKGFVRNCFFRNTFIASAERVVGFWDGASRGTADTISKARGKSREVFVYDVAGALVPEPQVAAQLAKVFPAVAK